LTGDSALAEFGSLKSLTVSTNPKEHLNVAAQKALNQGTFTSENEIN
jgi:hypothetical protein